MTDNAVYGYNLKDDTNNFPDNQKYGFLIYGTQKDILSYIEEIYSDVLEKFPEASIVREYEDGTDMDIPVINANDVSDEKYNKIISFIQGSYVDKGFNVGPVETKTNREWIYQAFGIEDFPVHQDCDMEVDSVTDVCE